MARETLTIKTPRCGAVTAGLKQAYPEAQCELNFSSPLQLLIATILSAQCTDRQVNVVTPALFQKYLTAHDFARVSEEELGGDIRRIGLYRAKARNIKAACQTLVAQFGGEVPRTMEELVQLNGVGRKTANVVLGVAYGLAAGVVVDTHVARLSRRLDFSRSGTPEKIELDLQKIVPKEEWVLFSHLLIWHGRRRCVARSPQCEQCEVQRECPTGQRILNPRLSPAQREKLRKVL